MTPEQFCNAIERLGLTQEQAGEWLKVSGRTGQRYATGETAIPGATAMLLRLMLKLKLNPKEVR